MLSDESKRKVYDQYGEEALKGGIPGGSGGGAGGMGGAGMPGGFHFNFKPAPAHDVFRSFFSSGFGADDGDGDFDFGGLSGLFGMGGGMPRASASSAASSGGARRAKKEAKVVERTVECTLEDLFHGFQKKLKITKRIEKAPGQFDTESEIIHIEGKPGWKAGTKITYPGVGDRLRGEPAQDIRFTIAEKPHARFSRQGDDLHVTVDIPLADALCGTKITVKGIDDASIPLDVPYITPDATRNVPDHGMPKKAGGRGRLIVHFRVIFPRLSDDQKKRIRDVLSASSS